MPKADTAKAKQRHDPLHVELDHGNGILTQKNKRAKKQARKGEEEDAGQGYVDASMSRKILSMAKEQQREIDEEEGTATKKPSRGRFTSLEDDEEAWEDEEGDYYSDEAEDEDDFEEYHEIEELEVDPEEEALFNKYMGRGGEDEDEGPQETLADKIMAKVREKELAEKGPQAQEDEKPEGVMLPPKVIEVYQRVGELLTRYRSGKLPKVFKMIPSLKNWEDVLYVTQPEGWTPNAVYEATRLFVSNLKAKQSEMFVRMVLLERFRDDVQNEKTLNYHLYRSLKKALYKPAAFFKGFLFPLCESGTCTLREAVIVGSILSKVSIPILHSAVALLRLAEMDYAGPNSLFIKVLLDKKYALPYRVVDAMVFHFMRFRAHPTTLPVIWHQSFLVFAQRYKNDITPDQRDGLLDVVQAQTHHSIGPEIRRELISGKPRDEVEMEIDG
ncbi:hypothetical protein TRICI_003704 [Trichomonascus ciferrii]|uniref:Bystin n=1 Tax=Trichomonascus ciferrii TaxID=44093 RepID=A0A642V390_9ASCO|nr:hypothetical protein TRICI_003704 [Trichomonascus ciferrii]